MAEVSDIMRGAVEAGIGHDRVLSAIRRAVTSLLAEEGGKPPTIFLSYSYEDKAIVSEVAKELQAAGLHVWFDLSEIRWGDSLWERIDRAIDSADFMAYFMSKNSLAKMWPQQELRAIISRELSGDRGAMVLPILLDDAEIPPVLRDKKYLDLRDGDLKGKTKEMIAAIRHQMRNRRLQPDQL